MAVRTISTRLVMEGESAYRAVVKQINQELKTLDSELKLVESSFKGQQNSLAALEAKHKSLSDAVAKQTEKLNAEKNALSQMQDLQRKYAQAAEEARSRLKALSDSTDDATKETEEYKAQITAIEKEIAKYDAAQKSAAEKVELHAQKSNQAQVTLNGFNEKLAQNEKYLDEAKTSADGCATSIDKMGREIKETARETDVLETEMKAAGDEAKTFGDKGKAGVEALASALAAAGVTAGIKAIVRELTDCVQASMDLESAMAGVAKTTDLPDEELARLKEALQQMSLATPMAATELGAIMEMAGQLGVRGSENLLKFTQVIADLSVSTNLTSESAATMLAQFANVSGMPIESVDRLGAVIVALGNNFATTESDIVNMAQRLVAAGTQIGMSEAEIMAFAAALSSVGIEAEAGGTAFSKLMISMQVAAETGEKGKKVIDQTGLSLRELQLLADQDSVSFKELAASMGLTSGELKDYMGAVSDLDNFAKVTGLTAEQFAKAYGEDAAGAMMQFLAGLYQIDQEGGSAIVTLNEMGLTEVRLRNAILSATNAVDLFGDAQTTANRAWAENAALQKEAQTRYSTTESKVALFKNSVNNLRVAIGDQLNPTIRRWVDTGSDVAQWAEGLVRTHPELVQLITALVSVAGGFIGVSIALAAVVQAFHVLLPLLAGNPWILAVGAIAGVSLALLTLAGDAEDVDESIRQIAETAEEIKKRVEDANEAYEGDADKINATADAAQAYLVRLQELEDQSSRTEAEQYEYARTVEQLKYLIPGLNLDIDEQTGLLKEGAEAILGQVDAWKEAAIAEAILRRQQTLIEAMADAWVALKEAEYKYSQNQTATTDAVKKATEAQDELYKLTGLTAEALRDMETLGVPYLTNLLSEGLLDEAGFARARELMAVWGEQSEAIETLDKDAKVLEESMSALGGTYEETAESVGVYKNSSDEAAQETQENVEANQRMQESLEALQTEASMLQAEMDELISVYDEAYKAAYQNITNTMGLFDEIEVKTKTKVKDMIEALDSQIAFMDTYAENIREAAKLGIDDGLLLTLSDGTLESARYLAEIVADGGKNMAALNEKFRTVEQGKEDFASQIAAMRVGFDADARAMVDIMEDMVSDFNQHMAAYTGGAETMQGLLDGLRSKQSEVNAILASISSALAEIGAASQLGQIRISGSHASGLEDVPYDGYLAELHRGEMVLTALQAKAYRAEQFANYAMPARLGDVIHNNANWGGITVIVNGASGGADAGRQAAAAFRRAVRYKGGHVN